jgi:hypothetical protein
VEQQLAINACQAGHCLELIDRRAVFCDACDRLLHDELRRELLDAWRPGRPPTKRFLAVLERARTEIRAARAMGHRVQKDEKLPW